MKVAVVTAGIGHHYPRGVARLIQDFEKHSPGYQITAWVNTPPPGAPERVIENGFDYTGYCAKPFAMLEAMRQGADVVLWLDASVRPVRNIAPLVDHICAAGAYMAPTGFSIGEWSSDRCLESLLMERGGWMDKPECASGIVGVDVRWAGPRLMIEEWARMWRLFPGHHSNVNAADKKHHYRNVGHVSDDPRCSGHRQDQTILSILAHRYDLNKFVPWPKFVAYAAGHGGAANESTCLLIDGLA